MPTPSVAIVDTLNSLLEAEAHSIFRRVGPGSPFLGTASETVRKPLAEMSDRARRHAAELRDLIHRLGGSPARLSDEEEDDERYLNFLSLRFLIPKLVNAERLMIERYENALATIDGSAEVSATLQRHLVEQRGDLLVLQRVSEEVTKPK